MNLVRMLRRIIGGSPASMFAVACHFVLFSLWIVLYVNVGYVFGRTITDYSLLIAFITYVIGCVGAAALFSRAKLRQRLRDVVLFVLACSVVFLLMGLLANTYDTSYDGQSYHQSGVYALADGWNPVKRNVPAYISEGRVFVEGYPKSPWIIDATIYRAFDAINAATIVNLIAMYIAFAALLFLLSSLGVGPLRAVLLSIVAVVQYIPLQQVFTFMLDGLSYELGLAAIAMLVILIIKQKSKLHVHVVLYALLILLVGAKYNNLPFVGCVALIYGYVLVKNSYYRRKSMVLALASAFLAALAVLWCPYVLNMYRHGSPLYPMNQKAQRANLRYDNIPSNLKTSSRPELLFYGIFSRPQPTEAGDPKSALNVATLKVPATLTNADVRSAANFQGRVGAGGPLFGLSFVLAAVLLIALWRSAKNHHDIKILRSICGVILVTLTLSLINPVPNKLRYAPFILLLPVAVLLASYLMNRKATVTIRSLRWGLLVALIANSIICTVLQGVARHQEFAAINQQLRLLTSNQDRTYRVVSPKFYSVYRRMDEKGVPYIQSPTCIGTKNQGYIEFSSKTARYCR